MRLNNKADIKYTKSPLIFKEITERAEKGLVHVYLRDSYYSDKCGALIATFNKKETHVKTLTVYHETIGNKHHSVGLQMVNKRDNSLVCIWVLDNYNEENTPSEVCCSAP